MMTPEQVRARTAELQRENAMATQVGGQNYKTLTIQPVEFAMRNDWDFCASSTLKYLTRWRTKGGLVDLQKGRHFVQLGMELGTMSFTKRVLAFIRKHVSEDYLTPHVVLAKNPPQPEITMGQYVYANRISDSDAVALMALDSWVAGRIGGDVVIGTIDRLIANYEQEKQLSLLP